MNRLIILGLATTLGAAYVSMQGTPVELQTTSPGTAQTGHLNISGTATVGILKSQNTVFGQSTAPTGFAYGGYFTAASNQARGFYGYASSPTGLTYGGFFQNASDSGRAVYGLATSTTGFNYGGYFQTASTGGRGLLGVAAAPTGTTYGVYGTAVSPTGFGVFSDGNFGVTGETTLAGKVLAGDGAKTLGSRVAFREDQSSGYPTLTVHNAPSTVIYTSERRAIIASARGSGSACTAIMGVAVSNVGNPSAGIRGSASGDGINYGVYGGASNGSSNYAGYFNGVLYATSASSGVKAFLIDHPMDPANKYLEHSSVESDERMNVYRGSVITDSRGYASVHVPSWFGALNEDVKYQLTIVDENDSAGFVLAKVVKRLKNGSFRIRTSEPGVDVDWQISGRRHDPVAKRNPLQVERMKNGDERGRYLEPEAYGMDRSLGMPGTEMTETVEPSSNRSPSQTNSRPARK